MQASLAAVGRLLELWTWHETGEILWLAGAVVLLGNWPFALVVMMPANNPLMEQDVESPDATARDLILKWGKLHAIRSALDPSQ